MNRAGVEAMKNPERYRHLRVDWVGQSSTQSITLCGVEGEDRDGTDPLPRLRPGRRGSERLWVGPESLRELFDALRVFGPSEIKAKMEALRGLRVQMDMQDRASLN